MTGFGGHGGPEFGGRLGGPKRDFGGPCPLHHPPYGHRRAGYGLGGLLLTGLAAAAAGALISKTSQNKNTTNKTKDVADDDGFVW